MRPVLLMRTRYRVVLAYDGNATAWRALRRLPGARLIARSAWSRLCVLRSILDDKRHGRIDRLMSRNLLPEGTVLGPRKPHGGGGHLFLFRAHAPFD